MLYTIDCKINLEIESYILELISIYTISSDGSGMLMTRSVNGKAVKFFLTAFCLIN